MVKAIDVLPHLKEGDSPRNNDKWVMHFRLRKGNIGEKYALLKIDVNKLPDDVKFYLDPRMKNGVYTLQGISPTAITVVEENIAGNLM